METNDWATSTKIFIRICIFNIFDAIYSTFVEWEARFIGIELTKTPNILDQISQIWFAEDDADSLESKMVASNTLQLPTIIRVFLKIES